MKKKNAYKPIGLPDSVLVIAILSIAAGLAGCAQDDGVGERTGRQIDQTTTTAGETVEGARKSLGEKTEKAGEYINDSAITASIKAKLFSDPLLALSNINVTTSAGVVTLSGTVDSQQAIDRALEIARRHPNVKSVEHNLAIKPPTRG